MRVCFWLFLALIAATGRCDQAPDKPTQQHASQHRRNPAPQPTPVAVDSTKNQQQPTEAYEPKCDKPRSEGELEACAQLRQAKAAETLNDLTVAQVQIAKGQLKWTGFEVTGLVISIIVSAIAAIAAIRAAQYAGDAVRTDRAWVTSHAAHWRYSQNTNIGGVVYPQGISFTVPWLNSGRTPALQVDLVNALRHVPIDAPCQPFDFQWPAQHEFNAVIGPGVAMQTIERGFGGAQFDQLVNRTHKVILFSAISYLDVYSTTRHESQACVEITINGVLQRQFAPPEYVVQVKPVGPQNTAT
jgi:hypothetical protein